MTLLLALLLFIAVRPADGGNHPRKEDRQPVSGVYKFNEPTGFHPPKEWDR